MSDTTQQPDLPTLTAKAEELKDLDSLVTEKEVELAALKFARKELTEIEIPTLMREIGIESLELTGGSKIAIQEFVDARIKDPVTAFEWLRETNNDSIIKNQITINLGRNEDSMADEIINKLKRENGVDAEVKVTVHNQTLKAFCKDALSNADLAETLPREAFGIYQGKRAKISQK